MEFIVLGARIEKESHKKLKAKAALNGEAIQDVIQRLVNQYLEENEKGTVMAHM